MDIIGLADETVAHEGLTHEYLLKRNPDLLILQDLYLIKASQAEGNNAESYSDIRIEIEGVPLALDIKRYTRKFKASEYTHSGAWSTFQVVTMPSFANNYIYVTNWDFGGRDRYYVFVRRDYAQLDELIRILHEDR